MLASLRHPNIISVPEYGFDEQQQPYFTMEFLDDAVDILSDSDQSSLERKLQRIV